MMAQEAALKEFANTRLRRLSGFNKSFARADVQIGDTALFFKAQGKRSAPRRRSPALILGIDETGATAKFTSQTLRVARFCARKREKEKDVAEAGLHPARVRLGQSGSDLVDQLRQVGVEEDMEVGRDEGNCSLGTGAPEGGSDTRPDMKPVPASPPLSAQLPTPRQSAVIPQPAESPRGRKWEPSQVPWKDGAQYEELTWGQIHVQRSRREYREKRNRKRS